VRRKKYAKKDKKKKNCTKGKKRAQSSIEIIEKIASRHGHIRKSLQDGDLNEREESLGADKNQGTHGIRSSGHEIEDY